VEAEIIPMGTLTLTSAQAAQALGVGRDRIAKSVLFIDERGSPLLVVVGGLKKVSQGRLATMLGLKRTRLATRDEVLRITGYPAGGIPPVGHATRIRTVVDRELLSRDFVFAGGGSEEHMVRIRPADIAKLQRAEILNVPSV